jgi:hypothetical protein
MLGTSWQKKLSPLSVSELVWTGDNLIEVSNLLKHDNFWHKKEVLIVKNETYIAYINKGDKVEINHNGDVINKVEGDKLDASVIASVERILIRK